VLLVSFPSLHLMWDLKPALVHAVWSQHSCRTFGSFFSYDAGHSPSSHITWRCLQLPGAAPPGPGSQGWCCAALSQGVELGQRDLPGATAGFVAQFWGTLKIS